jgi:hypothetical protein
MRERGQELCRCAPMGKREMNVGQFYRALGDEDQRTLEDLLIQALQSQFESLEENITCAKEEADENPWEADRASFREAQRDLAIAEANLYWFLEILGALITARAEEPFDCAAIEEVLKQRRSTIAAWQRESGEADGETHEAERSLAQMLPATPLKVLDFNRPRRGRPPKYQWQEFVAEMTRQCVEGPISDQASLERHMAQWCADTWGSEPVLSQIRDWVGPAFKAIHPAETGALKLSAEPD